MFSEVLDSHGRIGPLSKEQVKLDGKWFTVHVIDKSCDVIFSVTQSIINGSAMSKKEEGIHMGTK